MLVWLVFCRSHRVLVFFQMSQLEVDYKPNFLHIKKSIKGTEIMLRLSVMIITMLMG